MSCSLRITMRNTVWSRLQFVAVVDGAVSKSDGTVSGNCSVGVVNCS